MGVPSVGDIVKISRQAGGVFSCKCGSQAFKFVGWCGDSGGIDEAIDCEGCGKAWCVGEGDRMVAE